MIFTSNNKIRLRPLRYQDKEEAFKLTKRIQETNIAVPLNLLNNWNLLSILEINSYEIISHYIHFLCKQILDEN